MKNISFMRRIINFLLMLIGMTLLMASCREDNNVDKDLSRLFRPISFSVSVTGSTAEFSWIPIEDATYSLEISRDSMLFETDFQVIKLGNVDRHVVEDLWGNSRYSARIKAVSSNPATKDSEYQERVFTTQTENIFYTIEENDIEANQVLLKWREAKVVNLIVVSTSGADDVIISLSAEDVAASQKLISELTPDTEYTFRIYMDERRRGSVSIKTKPE